MVRRSLSAILLLSTLAAYAGVIDDAKDMIDAGDYGAAQEILLTFLPEAKSSQQGDVNALISQAMYLQGHFEDAGQYAEAAVAKKNALGYLIAGRLNYLDYDFDAAQQMYDKYEAAIRKSKKSEDEDFQADLRRLEQARRALYNVEQIVVIDSITAPKSSFFKRYRLPASAGRITDGTEMPVRGRDVEPRDVVFHSEKDDFVVWTMPDSVGVDIIADASRLIDGSWNMEFSDSSVLNGGGDAAYPFMMSDGLTLYYANDGDESLGGYDIFMTVRDSGTGEYFNPQNMGMPYNSPYDDYMLAIDEENGVGWWATDRNRLGDDLTIYLFLVNDLRQNYNPDEENIIDLARISDYKAGWQEPSYDEILRQIAAIEPAKAPEPEDFRFVMPDGSVLTRWDELSSRSATDMMKRYLNALEKYESLDDELEQRRKEYSSSRKGADAAVLQSMESSVASQRKQLRTLRNELYRSLGVE